MAILITENFDGVTAPTLPSDVTLKAATGSAVTNSSDGIYLSSPNSLKCVPTTKTTAVVYSNNPDASNGNCTVTGSIYMTTAVAGFYCGLQLGVGGQWVPNAANDNSYIVLFSNTDIYLQRGNLGVYTTIKDLNQAGGMMTLGVWYTVSLTRNGSTFWVSIQRQSDLNWLTTTGTWQSNYIACIIQTDASPLSNTASYGGIFLNTTTTNIAYGDNLSVRDLKNGMPAGPLKGMCIQSAWYPNNLNNIGQVWGTNYYLTGQGGLQTQVNLAKSIGCNVIRMSSGLDAVYTGQITMNTYLSRVSTMIAYCKSLGMWWYHDEDQNTQFFAAGGGQQASLFNAHVADLVSVAQVLAGYNNVLGFDICNEAIHQNTFNMYNGSFTLAGTFAMSAALWEVFFQQAIASIRAVAPNLPLTASYSFPSNAAGWTVSGSPSNMYQFDFIDQHIGATTYAPAVGDSQNAYLSIGSAGKKLWLGETSGGHSVDRTTALTNVWNNAVLATYSGQPGCIGTEWYVVVPDISGANDSGAWDGSNPAVPRADVVTTMQGFTSPSYSFGGNFRRRRR